MSLARALSMISAVALAAGCALPPSDEVDAQEEDLAFATYWVPIGEPPYCLGSRPSVIDGQVTSRVGLDWCDRWTYTCNDVTNFRTGLGGYLNCEFLLYGPGGVIIEHYYVPVRCAANEYATVQASTSGGYGTYGAGWIECARIPSCGYAGYALLDLAYHQDARLWVDQCTYTCFSNRDCEGLSNEPTRCSFTNLPPGLSPGEGICQRRSSLPF